MKKILSAILLICIVQVTHAQVLGGGLTGSGTRILQVNSSGELIPLTPGTSSQVLFGNGTWASPSSVTYDNLNVSTTITSPKLVTGRIVAPDTNGVHLGDSSMIFSTTLGQDNMRSSSTKISIGTGARAFGLRSVAIGSATETDGDQSVAIGWGVKTATGANNSIALGTGYTSHSMVNSTANSLAVGFNSTVPTFFVSGGNGTANSTGKVGIGYDILSTSNLNGNPTPYKTLTVYGDVSLANYSTASGGNHQDGATAIEILGADQVPTARGMAIDNDPAGDFNFYINNNQGAGGLNGLAEFNFLAGTNPGTYNHAANAAAATMLMKLDQNGILTLPKLPTTNTGYSTLVVENATGKLVPGGAVSSTSAIQWVLGGNSSTASQGIGSLNSNDDLPLIAGGSDRLHIEKTGDIYMNTGKQLTFASGDPSHGIGYFDNTTTNAFGVGIDGPVVYGWTGGALGTTFNGTKKVILSWNHAGQATLNVINSGDAFMINDVTTNKVNFKVKSTGLVYAREIKVTSVTTFPDYVFDRNYKRLSLEEMKLFTEKNHRLPNMPSAEEVKKDGLSLGEVQRVSVEKIEEIFLYMYEQQKQIKDLNEQVNTLKQEITKLKSK